MDKILPIANDMLVIAFDLIIFTRMLTLKRDNALYRTIEYTGCAVIILFYFAATYILNWPASLASAVCMSLPSMLLFWSLSKCKDSRFFLTFCFVDTVSIIFAFISRYVGILAGSAGSIATILVTIALFSAVLFFGRNYFKKYTELLTVEKVGWSLMMTAALVIYFALVFFAVFPEPLINRLEYAPVYLVFGAVVLLCYAVFIQSILKTKKIYEQYQQLQREQHFHKLAFTDALTGLANRAGYMEKINELERAPEQYGSICCLVFDIDNFKSINDRFGHHVGDEILKKISEIMRRTFDGPMDDVFRMGGDEFFAICVGAEPKTVCRKLSGIRCELHREALPDGSELSLAAGFAFLNPQEPVTRTIEQTFILADQNMYEDKNRAKKANDCRDQSAQ